MDFQVKRKKKQKSKTHINPTIPFEDFYPRLSTRVPTNLIWK